MDIKSKMSAVTVHDPMKEHEVVQGTMLGKFLSATLALCKCDGSKFIVLQDSATRNLHFNIVNVKC